MHNKNSNFQGRALNVIKVIFPYYKELLIKLREVPVLKRDTIEENHCLIQ